MFPIECVFVKVVNSFLSMVQEPLPARVRVITGLIFYCFCHCLATCHQGAIDRVSQGEVETAEEGQDEEHDSGTD